MNDTKLSFIWWTCYAERTKIKLCKTCLSAVFAVCDSPPVSIIKNGHHYMVWYSYNHKLQCISIGILCDWLTQNKLEGRLNKSSPNKILKLWLTYVFRGQNGGPPRYLHGFSYMRPPLRMLITVGLWYIDVYQLDTNNNIIQTCYCFNFL